MSLTDFVEDVKPWLNHLFDMPTFDLKGEMKAAPVSISSGLIGTAFDYVLRLQVAKINRDIVQDFPIVAEAVSTGDIQRETIINDFVSKRDCYIEGNLDLTDILADCLKLARLETIYRSGKDLPPWAVTSCSEDEIADLTNLSNLINPEMWQAKNQCILNPRFGKSSPYIGGADADLIIDNNLIDIKTTKYLKFTRQYFRQLIGYHLLNCREQEMYKGLEHLGIYYSRHGILFTFPIPNMKRNIKFGDKVVDEEVIESWIQIYHEEINKVPAWRIP